jgi:proton-dependent oligopeptide transporter, POT family
MVFRHSKGLRLLVMTEMWERFSFYTLRSLMVLYMTATLMDGGLGWTKGEALRVYGFYIGAAYLMPIVGGYFADRFLGQRRSTMIGAILMAVGHFLMAFNDLWFFYGALTLVAVGNGFFKPCLTSILGELYNDASESQRDSAYSLFYMGINIGAFAAGIVAGWALQAYGFDLGFTIAGFGMLLSLLLFWSGKNKYLGTAGLKPQVRKDNDHIKPLTAEQKSRVGVIVFLFLMMIFYFIAWEQMGGLVTLFIHESVNRTVGGWEIPTPWLANIDPFMIVFLAPLLSLLWVWLGRRGRDPFLGAKFGIGFALSGIAFLLIAWLSTLDRPNWGWMVLYKFIVVVGELCVIPISWAAVTNLSPVSYTTRMMGLMLAGIGIGSYIAGYVGSFVDQLGETFIFYCLMGGLFFFSIVCFAMNPKLKKMSRHTKVSPS